MSEILSVQPRRGIRFYRHVDQEQPPWITSRGVRVFWRWRGRPQVLDLGVGSTRWPKGVER